MKKIAIIGCGFGGLSATSLLCGSGEDLEVVVFDRKDTFDFLPVLPDCLGRGIPPAYLTCKIETIGISSGFRFVNEEVVYLQLSKKEITTASATHHYDYLIIASGSETNFYGNKNIEDNSYSLDDAADAARLINLLKNERFGTYIVGGGGYTGIEVAVNLRVFLEKSRRLGRVLIIERAPSILGPLPQWIKDYTTQNLKKMEVDVQVDTSIEKIDGRAVRLSSGEIVSDAAVVWAAGVKTAPFVQDLSAEKNPQGRVKVDESLRISDDCFVIGDAAYFSHKGVFLRMAVQFAISEGRIAALNILNSIKGSSLEKYKPRDVGYIIPMANNLSCGEVMGLKVKGRLATLLHYMMCAYRSCGMRNKLGVLKGAIKTPRLSSG